ncbi:MAG: Uracil DNA glycosylase superfamily protein [Chloroflexi bacterium OLB15]|nr:MAG: Uracil DNA glycosylase superfamily protein [Chloroflexi bacterium OLB15]
MGYDFSSFIDRVSLIQTAPDAYNQFGAGDNPYNAIRRANLSRYLQDLFARQTEWMLLGEAPGYRGMRLTGLPMTGRRQLRDGVPELGVLGLARGYQDVPEPGFEAIQSEQTATILWNLLPELGIVPLVWGAFPFHPHEPGKMLSNRKPRANEVKLGQPLVRELLEIFKPKKVIAVGNVGYGLLTEMGVPCVKVRHPAQGGKNDFVAGMRAAVQG